MVFVAVVAILIIGFFLPYLATIDDVDLNLKAYSPRGWDGGGCTGGLCTMVPPNGPGGPGNLLDQSEYVASWSPNLIGQRVTLQGGVRPALITGCTITGYHYDLHLEVDGEPDQHVLSTDVSSTLSFAGGWVATPSLYWDMKSPDGKTVIPEGARVHARFYYRCFSLTGEGWNLAAEQTSFVHTGIGTVNWGKGQHLVGETAVATWHIGYVAEPQTNRGWTVYVTSGAQGGKTVAGPIDITQTDGRISYVVTDADFSTANPANELTVHLKNELWSKQYDVTTTITKAELARIVSERTFTSR